MEQVEVMVVGAGLAGLSAAKYLHEEGINVVVLEARDRVGGRIYTAKNCVAEDVDMGGTFFVDYQERLVELLSEYGIETVQTSEEGDYIYFTQRESRRFKAAFPPMKSLLGYLDIRNVFRIMEKMSIDVVPGAPWESRNAKKLDQTSFDLFLHDNVWTREAYNYVKGLVNGILAAEPHECSLLYALWRFRQMFWRPDRLESFEKGHEAKKTLKGVSCLSSAMANEIGKDRVYLNHAVCQIMQKSDDLIVVDTQQKSFSAKYVILAVPIHLQNKISYHPPLPSYRNQLIQRYPLVPVIVTFAFYKEPFWKKKGFCGTVISPDEQAPVTFVIDYKYSKPVLKGYIAADKARCSIDLTKEQRKEKICQFYAKAFETDEALHPTDYEELDWSKEQWSGGGFAATPPAGLLTTFGSKLKEPVGNLYFACSEMSMEYTSSMEGAIREGEMTAKQILVKLGKVEMSNMEHNFGTQTPVPPLYKTTWMKILPSVPTFLGFMGLTSVVSTVAIGFVIYSKYHT